jgi:dihydropteroate synthase
VRLSSEERRGALELLLSPPARALEARAALRGVPGALAPELARLWMAGEALGDELRGRLEALGELRPGRAGGLAHLTIRTALLADLATAFPDARVLHETWAAAVRRPGRTLVLGIVNVTPDSFSDGGRLAGPEEAVAHGLKLIEAGADMLDVGGESTRPGAAPVRSEDEIARTLPVVERLTAGGARVSIDTSKASVARAALEAGALLVNDVQAGRGDPRLLAEVASREAALLLMHMKGTPRDMQVAPCYDDVVREVVDALRTAAASAVEAGVDPTRIAIDPGFGFGKELEHNLELLRAIPELRSLGLPVAIGVSRKSFLGRLSGQAEPCARRPETSAATALAAWLGAEIHRVHEPDEARAALAIAGALGQVEGQPA